MIMGGFKLTAYYYLSVAVVKLVWIDYVSELNQTRGWLRGY